MKYKHKFILVTTKQCYSNMPLSYHKSESNEIIGQVKHLLALSETPKIRL